MALKEDFGKKKSEKPNSCNVVMNAADEINNLFDIAVDISAIIHT